MSLVRVCRAAASLCVWLTIGVTIPAGIAHPRAEADPLATALFSAEWVPRIEIKVDEAGLNVLRGNSANRYSTPNRPNALATVREGTNVYRQVAIHLKGSAGSFRDLDDKPALTLHFNEHIPAQRFHGLDKISLNNSVQDATYMCEILGRRIYNSTSVPVPRAGHASVVFNGQSLGLYVLLEGWNKQFLKQHFADARGNFYEGAFRDDITASLELKSGAKTKNRADLDALVAASQERDPERRFAAMERVLDINRFVTFVALEVMLNHWDGYSLHVNNYRIFHDNSSGKLVFMPHGMDQLFGVRRRMFDSQILPEMSGMVARTLLETRSGRRLYLDRMAALQTNVFEVTALTGTVDKLAGLVRPVLQSDPGALAEFNATVPVLRQRLADRHMEIRQQLAEMRSLEFNAAGEARLAALTFRRAGGGRSRGGRFSGDFQEQFNGRSSGFRALVLLEPGQYRFQALAHTRIEDRVIDTNAIALRSSEGTAMRRHAVGKDQMLIEHDFALKDRNYVALTYDLAGFDGVNALDKESLKLITKLSPQNR